MDLFFVDLLLLIMSSMITSSSSWSEPSPDMRSDISLVSASFALIVFLGCVCACVCVCMRVCMCMYIMIYDAWCMMYDVWCMMYDAHVSASAVRVVLRKRERKRLHDDGWYKFEQQTETRDRDRALRTYKHTHEAWNVPRTHKRHNDDR